MKTIIGFDSWTEGSHHYERLVPEFQRKGYRLLLIHIGSWGHDKGRPMEEMIGKLSVRDISYYKNQSFDKIIRQEDPAAVLFLSTRAFAHMAFNRYAYHMNIPTCNLYHGLVNVQAVNTDQQAYKVEYLQHAQILLLRAWKNIALLVPSYIRSLFFTSASRLVWRDLVIEVLAKASGISRNRLLRDSKTTIGCVYVKADIEHMERYYGVSKTNVYVVGNPDFMKFELDVSDVGRSILQSPRSGLIIYIDTGFLGMGLVYNSFKDYLAHILDTKKVVEDAGFCFAIKLKPHSALVRSGGELGLVNNGIMVIREADFMSLLRQSAGAIVEPSTAAMIPTALGLPLFLAAYGPLKNQAYGQVLTSYPRAHLIEDLSELSRALSRESDPADTADFLVWSADNLGPLPAEDMPKRVVEAIDKTVREHERLCVG
ncbi:hypothetical protein JZU69_02360 [bacterium]|jgi:hypothetical protein|nr:hypothetical protein [bacterium]